ncbi:MAG: hypothetical protein K2X93_23515 [Candidatus Obscuribacterales bacterium]|nr:hypothetical protein [Candidatus Obscuribacterales bacterium]
MTGQYVTNDGTAVQVPSRNLRPDKYKSDTPEEKKRSLASHIAQPLLINVHWSRHDSFGEEKGLKGKIAYEEGHTTDFPGDKHNRMMDYSKSPPQPFWKTESVVDPTADKSLVAQQEVTRPIEGPGMHMEDIPCFYKQLRGNKGDLTVVNHRESEGVIKPKSAEHFKKIIEDAQSRNKPIVMGVFANRDPFLSDLRDSYNGKAVTDAERKAAQDLHAHHALVGYRFDSAAGNMAVENQWGNRVDHTGKPGQKDKLSVEAIYDTLIEKPRSAAKGDGDKVEATPEQHIDLQRRFVETLAQDNDVSPDRVFNERMTLHKYLTHWGHKEEAHKEAETLSKFMVNKIQNDKPIAKSEDERINGTRTFNRETKNFLDVMKIAGESKIVRDVLKAADERFANKTLSTSMDYTEEFGGLLGMHRSQGDTEGVDKLAHRVVSDVIGSVLKNSEDIASREKRFVISNLASTLVDNKSTKEIDRLFETLRTNIGAYEKIHGDATEAGAEARALILSSDRSDQLSRLKMQVHNEIKDAYDALKKKGDISSPGARTMRHILTVRYENQLVKNPEALNSLVQDTIKHILTTPDKDGKLGSPTDEKMLGPYEYSAERLQRGGGHKYSIPLLEKALNIAKEKNPAKVEDLAYRLVESLDNAGRFDDADKILKEHKLEEPFIRKPRKKD